MSIGIMDALVKKDLTDIAQVNIPSWLTVGWIKDWFSLDWISFDWIASLFTMQVSDPNVINDGIQNFGPSVIIVLTIGFTLFKIFRAIQHYRWAKEDRLEQVVKEQLEDNNG